MWNSWPTPRGWDVSIPALSARGITYGAQARQFLGLTGQENITCMLVGYPTHKYLRTVPRKALQDHWF